MLHVARLKHSSGTFSESHRISELKTSRLVKIGYPKGWAGPHNFDEKCGSGVYEVAIINIKLITSVSQGACPKITLQ